MFNGHALRWWAVCLAMMSPLLAAPVAKVVKQVVPDQERLNNGSLGQIDANRFAGWTAYEAGYQIERTGGREHRPAAICENPDGKKRFGLSQTVKLNQTSALPLLIEAWSKAEGVIGNPDADYALYLDLEYTDGTPSWGHVATFSPGTHDWEHQQLRIFPDRPVKIITVNLLFRGRKGKVWFADASLKEPKPVSGATMFDGLYVQVPSGATHLVGRAELQIRDVAAGSDFFRVPVPADAIRPAEIPELNLAVDVKHAAAKVAGCRQIDITVRDLAGHDRALSVYYVQPLDATNWRWYDDVRTSRVIAPGQVYASTVQVGVGATGQTSRYPFACVAGEKRAESLMVLTPTICHLAYHAGTHEFYAAFDIGLARETKTPGAASFSLVQARTDPQWGMRDTARLYYELLPQYFDRGRVSRPQGNWMPFQAISSIPDFMDFGFAVHEGDNDVAWDNAHGIQAYVYVEPMTFWLTMPKEIERSYDGAMAYLHSFQQDAGSAHHDIARAVELSCTQDRDGRYHVDVLNAPWCNGAVFGNSADPDVPERNGQLNLAHYNVRKLEAAMKRAEPNGGLAGVYLDSLEGWGRLLDFRREHFAAADLPLTFDADSHRPVILNVMATQEWTEFIADWVHRRGKLLMANAVPHDFPFLALPLDLLGTETNWQQDGRFAPPPADFFYLKRTLAWHKPYMFLMNTHFETWTAELTEQYMRLCLYYGMWPGFFSENAATNCYFSNPAWYDRDRPVFRKYTPVIRRVAEAGWEPITLADSDQPDVWVERWGSNAASGMLLTVMNNSDAPRQANVRIADELCKAGKLRSLLSGEELGELPAFKLALPAHGVDAIEILPR